MYSFLGIGAQKAGTTWLYTMIKQHPHVDFPGGKEQHYWNRRFPQHPEEDYLRQFQDPDLIQGEITPAYGHLPSDTIKKIHDRAPDLKLIYILRNPISRAWSSALMALQRSEMTLDEASDQWFIDHFHSKGSLMRGDYEQCLRNWHSHYSKQQLLTLFYDDIITTPSSVIDQCCTHLHAPLFTQEEKIKMGLHQKIFSGSGAVLRKSLKPVLSGLYEKKIISLSNHLDKDLDDWLQ